MKILKILAVLTFALVDCADAGYEKPTIRVAIHRNADSFHVAVPGKFKITDDVTGIILDKGRGFRKTHVRVYNGEIYFAQKPTHSKQVTFSSKHDVRISFNGKEKRYRGEINVYVNDQGGLLVVNTLDLEKYVRGVLYHEVSDRWPMEAMKAQAIAVRTYALYQKKINKGRLYDVTSDIYSQVYGGKSAEHYRTNIASKRTKGKIMVYKKDIIPAYYSSNCGGHTEDVRELWDHDLTPLKGRLDPYCVNKPNYKWKKNYQSSQVQKKFIENGIDLGLIQKIEVLKRTESGRAKSIAIHTRDGKIKTVKGDQFRRIVGPNQLKSNKFEIEMKGYYFDVIGNGWGHGVGMCQWGANGMAKQKKNYLEILNFYYPEVSIVDYRTKDNHYLLESMVEVAESVR